MVFLLSKMSSITFQNSAKNALDKLTKTIFIFIRTLRFPYGTITIHLYNK